MTALTPAPLPASEELAPVLARVLDAARAQGATAAEAGLSYARGFSIGVRNAEVESLEFQRDRSLSLTVYFGHRKGTATTSDLSERGIMDGVAAACAIARVTEEDPCAGLADASLMARHFPDLDLDHDWAVTPDAAIELAVRCEAAALAVDRRIERSEGASVGTIRSVSGYANTHDFYGFRQVTEHSVSCAVVATGPGEMQRDYWYDSARDPARLMDAEAIGRRAGERTVARLGSRKIGTRQAPVLFVPEVARGLFGHLVGAISGGSLYRRSSFLVDKLGEAIFPEHVTIEQRPFLPQASGSSAYDQEGVATRDRTLIDRGVLQGWLLGSYSARKLGLETTGNAGGVFNLCVNPGTSSFEQLVADMGQGLIVTELMGQGVNSVTGDYSRGAAGFWVENGRIAFPVEGLTIAGNLLEMYRGIQALGNDVDVRSNVRAPSVLLDRMMIAGE